MIKEVDVAPQPELSGVVWSVVFASAGWIAIWVALLFSAQRFNLHPETLPLIRARLDLAAAALTGILLALVLRRRVANFDWTLAGILVAGWTLTRLIRFPQNCGSSLNHWPAELPTGQLLSLLILIMLLRRAQPGLRWWRYTATVTVWGGLSVLLRLIMCAAGPRFLLPFSDLALADSISALAGLSFLFWQLHADRPVMHSAVQEQRAELRTGINLLLRRETHFNPQGKRLALSTALTLPGWQELTRRAAPYIVAIILLLAFIACGTRAGFAAALVGVVGGAWFLVAVLPVLLFLFSPVMVAIMAALITEQDARDRGFNLIRLTNLTELDIVWGYVAATFSRVEGLLSYTVFAIPGLLMAVVFTISLVSIFVSITAILGSLALLALIIGATGLNLLGGASGVWLGLRLRSRTAVVLAPLLTLALPLVLLLLIFTGQPQTDLIWLTRVMGWLIFMVAPYVLATELLDDARRWVRDEL